jgi:hypothetical protein
MATYLYRILENDDEGDPLDFGVLRATDLDDAVREVTMALRSLFESGSWPVRFCPVAEVAHDLCGKAGEFVDREIIIAEEDGQNMPGLTKRQIERQDYVDNAIHNLIQSLNPEGTGVDWNLEVIGQVRDVIANYFQAQGICTEQEFYPYMQGENGNGAEE